MVRDGQEGDAIAVAATMGRFNVNAHGASHGKAPSQAGSCWFCAEYRWRGAKKWTLSPVRLKWLFPCFLPFHPYLRHNSEE